MQIIDDIRHCLPDYLGGKKIDPESRITRDYSTELAYEAFPDSPYSEPELIADNGSWAVDFKRANLALTYIQPSESSPELEAQSLPLHLESFLGHHIGTIELSNLSEANIAEIVNDLRSLPIVKKEEQHILLPSDLRKVLTQLLLTYPQMEISGKLGDNAEIISQNYALHLEVPSYSNPRNESLQKDESITVTNLTSGEVLEGLDSVQTGSTNPIAIRIHNPVEPAKYITTIKSLLNDFSQNSELGRIFDFERPIAPQFHDGLFIASIPLLTNSGATPFELSLSYMNVMVGNGAVITVQQSGVPLAVDLTPPLLQEPKFEFSPSATVDALSPYYFSAIINGVNPATESSLLQAPNSSLKGEDRPITNYLLKLLNVAIEHNLDQAISVECTLPRLKDAMHKKTLKLSSLVDLPDKTEKTALQVSIATEAYTRINDTLHLLEGNQLDRKYVRKYESVLSRLGAKVEDLRTTAQSISGEISEKEQKMRDRKNLVLAGIAGSLGILGIGSQLLSVADDIMMVQIQDWIAKNPGMQNVPHAVAIGSTVLMVLLLSSGTIGYRWHQRRISREESQLLDLDDEHN